VGVLLILLGIALAAVLADFLVENDVATAATQQFTLFGTSIELSVPMLVAIAFTVGVLAVLLVIAGVRRFRRGRRRLMQQRIEDLRDQNARLATQRNLEAVIHIPEAEPVVEVPEPVEVVAVPESVQATLPPPPVSVSAEDEPASKW
jgi:hypothetical protein